MILGGTTRPRRRPPPRLPAEALEDYAFRALGRRAHSVSELRQKLSRRAASPRDVDAVLERLLARHYLDDRRFALGYARYRSRRRYGRRRIEMELRRRGVAAELIEEALAEAFPGEGDERALVRQRIVKRLQREKKPYGMRLFRSLYASLLRAGFPSAIILDELFASIGRGSAAEFESIKEAEEEE